MKRAKHLDPVHPGDVLREDFMEPLHLSAYRVAKDLGVEPIAITSICKRRRSISAAMALKLARYFNTSPEIWTGLQAQYDLEIASRALSAKLALIRPIKRVGKLLVHQGVPLRPITNDLVERLRNERSSAV